MKEPKQRCSGVELPIPNPYGEDEFVSKDLAGNNAEDYDRPRDRGNRVIENVSSCCSSITIESREFGYDDEIDDLDMDDDDY